MRKEYSPVYKPTVNSGTDTSNFDPEFTAEPVVESLVPDSELATANKANFDSFTYVSSDQNSHLR
jgi:serum/glucocorticoid-regulated kinase 2